MKFGERLEQLQRSKKTFLCVGIDPELEKFPPAVRSDKDSLYRFCSEIIAATAPHAVAFKFNFAFFEIHGARGWEILTQLRHEVPRDCLTLADAKRGDIGNSAKHYATAILENLAFDAITVNPYLGFDAAEPFLAYSEKGIFFLCLTSNPGARDLQYFSSEQIPLYQYIAKLVDGWNQHDNCGLVVGATKPNELAVVRRLAPQLPILVPGVGAQGGEVSTVLRAAGDTNLVIAVSRSILYASKGSDFAAAAALAAQTLQRQMQPFFHDT